MSESSTNTTRYTVFLDGDYVGTVGASTMEEATSLAEEGAIRLKGSLDKMPESWDEMTILPF